jgi:hypothetical protein
MHCLVGEASLSIQTGELDGAQESLNRLGKLIDESTLPAASPPVRVHTLLQGRLDLARGKLVDARAGFDRALAHEGKDPTSMHVYVGRSGREALETAIKHLSNTIDPDHPYLLQARAELSDALHGATASNDQHRQ